MPLLPGSDRRSAERYRWPLWVWPLVSAVVAVAAGIALGRIRPTSGFLASSWFADTSAVSDSMQVVATSVMTALTLTFSLTVVALQLASQQFSPRLLREFTRDPVTKWVLAVLTGAFTFSITVLHGLGQDEPAPTVAALVGALLGLLALAAILAFITHIARVLRVDTMMLMVHDETGRAIARLPRYGDERRSPDELDLRSADGELVPASRSGFVQRTDVAQLVEVARQHGAVVRVEARAGDHVVRGTPLATVWSETGRRLGVDLEDEGADDGLSDAIRQAIVLDYERTLDQDTGFGLRQLEDIAVKAMSPSVNDPVTAAHAVGHLADLLVGLTERRLEPTLHEDEDGVGRAIVPDRDFRYYLDLACGQLRRFAAGEPTVLVALLRMLRDVAVACRDDDQRAEVRRAAHLVAGALDDHVVDADAELVRGVCQQVEAALAGDIHAAYRDAAGETRSM